MLPYRGDPATWLESLGLDPDWVKIISKPMSFPPRNRLINTGHIIEHFSGGDDYDEHWDKIVEKVAQLAERHSGERGLIHTVSYERAKRLAADLPDDLAGDVIVHRNDGRYDNDYYLQRW